MARGLRGIWGLVVKYGKPVLVAIARGARIAARFVGTKLRALKPGRLSKVTHAIRKGRSARTVLAMRVI